MTEHTHTGTKKKKPTVESGLEQKDPAQNWLLLHKTTILFQIKETLSELNEWNRCNRKARFDLGVSQELARLADGEAR